MAQGQSILRTGTLATVPRATSNIPMVQTATPNPKELVVRMATHQTRHRNSQKTTSCLLQAKTARTRATALLHHPRRCRRCCCAQETRRLSTYSLSTPKDCKFLPLLLQNHPQQASVYSRELPALVRRTHGGPPSLTIMMRTEQTAARNMLDSEPSIVAAAAEYDPYAAPRCGSKRSRSDSVATPENARSVDANANANDNGSISLGSDLTRSPYMMQMSMDGMVSPSPKRRFNPGSSPTPARPYDLAVDLTGIQPCQQQHTQQQKRQQQQQRDGQDESLATWHRLVSLDSLAFRARHRFGAWRSLQPDRWMTDEVIHFVSERLSSDVAPWVDPLALANLPSEGKASGEASTNVKESMRLSKAKHIILFANQKNAHWVVFILDTERRDLALVDPQRRASSPENQQSLEAVTAFLRHNIKPSLLPPNLEPSAGFHPTIPPLPRQQPNDCGPYVIGVALWVTNHGQLPRQTDMPDTKVLRRELSAQLSASLEVFPFGSFFLAEQRVSLEAARDAVVEASKALTSIRAPPTSAHGLFALPAPVRFETAEVWRKESAVMDQRIRCAGLASGLVEAVTEAEQTFARIAGLVEKLSTQTESLDTALAAVELFQESEKLGLIHKSIMGNEELGDAMIKVRAEAIRVGVEVRGVRDQVLGDLARHERDHKNLDEKVAKLAGDFVKAQEELSAMESTSTVAATG